MNKMWVLTLSFVSLMRARLASLLDLNLADIGITATSGEGLTDFGQGIGFKP